jgi:hypothetical protein
MERWGTEGDGGYAVPADIFSKANVLLTGGVANDVRFEAEVASKIPGIRIALFDHTIEAAPDHTPSNAKWHKLGLGPINTDQVVTLETARQLAGVNPGESLIVKLDIENWEWPLIENTDANFWENVSAVIIEFHLLGHRKDWPLYRSVLEKMNRHLIPIHIHANNCANLADRIGYNLPEVIELTYINRKYIPKGSHVKPWAQSSPTPLDRPNTPHREDPIVDYWKQDKRPIFRAARLVLWAIGVAIWWLKKCARWVKKRTKRYLGAKLNAG